MKYDVREVQTMLKAQGFDPGPIDGIFGPRTSASIIAFKKSIGYRARDYVGELTYAALKEGVVAQNPINSAKLPWLVEGYKALGWHERSDNSRLSKWLSSDDYALGDPSVLPWCGDFVDTALRLALPTEPRPGPLGKNPYWALNWRYFGVACRPLIGAIASVPRSGGGHVGFVVGQDDTRYYLLGGNQSNRVSVAPLDKSRFDSNSFRFPSTYMMDQYAGVPRMSSSEASSINEA